MKREAGEDMCLQQQQPQQLQEAPPKYNINIPRGLIGVVDEYL